MDNKKQCPICGKEVDVYHEVSFTEPFVHNNPFDGLHIYGAFSAPKETICFENSFLHFAFFDANNQLTDHRLVKLGVKEPSTQSPSEEYLAGLEDDEGEWQDASEWGDYDNSDNFLYDED